MVKRRNGRRVVVVVARETRQRVQSAGGVLPHPLGGRVAATVTDPVLLAVQGRSRAVQFPLYGLLELQQTRKEAGNGLGLEQLEHGRQR